MHNVFVAGAEFDYALSKLYKIFLVGQILMHELLILGFFSLQPMALESHSSLPEMKVKHSNIYATTAFVFHSPRFQLYICYH